VGWGDAGSEPGTSGQQPGALLSMENIYFNCLFLIGKAPPFTQL
jgi:hypothetical protein